MKSINHKPKIGDGILKIYRKGHMVGTVKYFDENRLTVYWVSNKGDDIITDYTWIREDDFKIHIPKSIINQRVYDTYRESYLKLL